MRAGAGRNAGVGHRFRKVRGGHASVNVPPPGITVEEHLFVAGSLKHQLPPCAHK
jgi:hypothetical protein